VLDEITKAYEKNLGPERTAQTLAAATPEAKEVK
jgi:hypothetical protein